MNYAEQLVAIGAAADDSIEELEADLVDARREVARLQAIVDAVSPQPAQPLFGSSFGKPIPVLDTVTVGRVYLQSGEKPARWDSDAAVRAAVGRSSVAVWVSIKVDDPAWLTRFLESFRETGLRVIVTFFHETENDGPGGTFPSDQLLEQRQATWDHGVPVCRQFPYVETACILMGSHPQSEWDRAYPRTEPDLVGFDCYNPGIQKAKAYVPPAQVFGRVIAYAAGKGKPLAIGETGTSIVNGDVAGRAAWAGAAREVLTAAGVTYACWWNQGGCALDDVTARAWLSW